MISCSRLSPSALLLTVRCRRGAAGMRADAAAGVLQALQFRDRNGNLPLHLAACYNASDAIVATLVEAYPAALRVQNSDGNLPLHLAVQFSKSPKVVRRLFKAYPGGWSVPNRWGETPEFKALNYRAWVDASLRQELGISYK